MKKHNLNHNYDVKTFVEPIDNLIRKHKIYEHLGKLHCNTSDLLLEDLKGLDIKVCSNDRDTWVNIYFTKPHHGVCQIVLL